MSTKALMKLVYISGMGLVGESFARTLAGLTGKTEGPKLLMRAAGAITGAYAGVIIANDLEEILVDISEEVSGRHDEENLEVNNG